MRAIYYPGIVPVDEVGGTTALRRSGHLRCLISCAAYKSDRVVDRAAELEEEGFHVIVDSGIFTLLYGPARAENPAARNDKLFSQWLRTIEDLAKVTKRATFVEWDAQDVVGLNTIRQYRAAAENVAPGRLMYVWHRADGAESLREHAGRYVGITLRGDFGYRDNLVGTAQSAARVLRSLGARVHLLGVSSEKILFQLRGLFDTFDSSSWCAETRFGSPESADPLERYLVYSKRHALAHEYCMYKELKRLREYVVCEEGRHG